MNIDEATAQNAPKYAALVLLTPAQMGEADRAAEAAGVSGLVMMEAAGAAVAVAIGERWPMRPVTVLCGPGNNGGDGFVAARHLEAAGWPVKVALLGTRDKLAGEAAHVAALWDGILAPFDVACLDGAGLVVDAIFGAGLARPLGGEALVMVEAMTSRHIPICAVDVPSGLDGASGNVLGAAAKANLTVTFFRKKPGHLLYPGRTLCGEIAVAEIGTPATVLDAIDAKCWENGPGLWQDIYPWPEPESYKYARGEVLILGGAAITGASRMTALAASRAGAGMVTLAAPEAVWAVYATSLINAIVRSLEDADGWQALLADTRRNVIAIGPGQGLALKRAALSWPR